MNKVGDTYFYGLVTIGINWIPGLVAAIHMISVYRRELKAMKTLIYAGTELERGLVISGFELYPAYGLGLELFTSLTNIGIKLDGLEKFGRASSSFAHFDICDI